MGPLVRISGAVEGIANIGRMGNSRVNYASLLTKLLATPFDPCAVAYHVDENPAVRRLDPFAVL